ncbi:MAG: hypothetical protein U0165_01205 [Polyangiaceae bacterium]
MSDGESKAPKKALTKGLKRAPKGDASTAGSGSEAAPQSVADASSQTSAPEASAASASATPQQTQAAPVASGGAAASAAAKAGAAPPKAAIFGVGAFAVFAIGGFIYMKTTDTGAAANKVMGDSPKTAASALGQKCAAPGEQPRPLIVDWDANDRTDLEASMKEGLVAIEYSCESVRIVSTCRIQGDYGYVGVTPKETLTTIDNADELRAQLPKTATGKTTLGLDTEIARGSTLAVAMKLVGQQKTTKLNVSREDLVGSCKGVTHFVKAAYVGAFKVQASEKASVKTAAEVFGAKDDAKSSASKSKVVADGVVESCAAANPDDPKAPDKCHAAVYVQLSPIAEKPNTEPYEKVAPKAPSASKGATAAAGAKGGKKAPGAKGGGAKPVMAAAPKGGKGGPKAGKRGARRFAGVLAKAKFSPPRVDVKEAETPSCPASMVFNGKNASLLRRAWLTSASHRIRQSARQCSKGSAGCVTRGKHMLY